MKTVKQKEKLNKKNFSFQVAKLSKLLIELERGNIHLYKGKSLDEIQFDLEGKLLCKIDQD